MQPFGELLLYSGAGLVFIAGSSAAAFVFVMVVEMLLRLLPKLWKLHWSAHYGFFIGLSGPVSQEIRQFFLRSSTIYLLEAIGRILLWVPIGASIGLVGLAITGLGG